MKRESINEYMFNLFEREEYQGIENMATELSNIAKFFQSSAGQLFVDEIEYQRKLKIDDLIEAKLEDVVKLQSEIAAIDSMVSVYKNLSNVLNGTIQKIYDKQNSHGLTKF